MGIFDFFRNGKSEREAELTESNVTYSGAYPMGTPSGLMANGALNAYEGTFIGDSFYDTGGVFGYSVGSASLSELEKNYVIQCRSIAMLPDVALGIEEIMRDLYDKGDPLRLNYEDGDVDEKALLEIFEKFQADPIRVAGHASDATPSMLILFNFIRQVYVDGQMCVYAASHEETDPDRPINEEKLFEKELRNASSVLKKRDAKNKDGPNETLRFYPLDPCRITYREDGKVFYDIVRGKAVELDPERLIKADFGLFDALGARFGFLRYTFKYANQLQALQDMLIPMRFRKSVARRIFNVDVAQLPQGRAQEFIKNIQQKFKYKKHYDSTSGKIVSKETEHTGLVEDYWFANRSGSKGTTVEMMDEAGNFNDQLEDVQYFNKKLYQSMFIPLRRIFESDAEYDYTTSSIEVDELRFNSFLTRLRFVFNSVLTIMFRKFAESENAELKGKLDKVWVELRYDNWFEKAKRKENLSQAMSLYEDVKDKIGVFISAETALKTIFDMSSQDVNDEREKIKEELDEESIYYTIHAHNAKGEDDGY